MSDDQIYMLSGIPGETLVYVDCLQLDDIDVPNERLREYLS